MDMNATQASIRAGYSVHSARAIGAENLTKPAVRAALAVRQGVDASRLQIERQDVIQGLLEAVSSAREQANPAAMIAGWKTIGQMLGYFEPKRLAIDVAAVANAEGGRYERMTDAELLELVNTNA